MMPEQDARELTIRLAEKVTLDNLRAVLGDKRLTWAYASRIGDIGLGWLCDLLDGRPLGARLNGERPGVPLDHWVEGRAFGPDLEVDWWREGETYRLRALLETGDPPDGVAWSELADERVTASAGRRYILLHGTLDKSSLRERPTWSEARVPRRLAHPHESEDGDPLPERVAVVSQDYERNHVVVLTRLIEVMPMDERGQEGDEL
jgi:hypothetical protein